MAEKTNLIKRETFGINTPQRAKQMAVVLSKHIKDNKLSANIAGKDYVMVEGWQFAGGLMGLFPQIVEVKELSSMRWSATAQIINSKTEKIVSTGYAICSKDEMKKKSFDEYAILSMAQTRAIGKAFRNYIGWIIKMAGYESTPAEEMPKDIKPTTEPAQNPLPTKKSVMQIIDDIKKTTNAKQLEQGKTIIMDSPHYTQEQKSRIVEAIDLRVEELKSKK